VEQTWRWQAARRRSNGAARVWAKHPDLADVHARGGDRAFGTLYERYGRMVHGVLLARVPRAHAEDLLQDVFVQALDRLHGLRDARAFGGWLVVMARNRAMDFHRAARATVEMTDDVAGAESTEHEALAVLAIVRTLPEAYRETLVLRLVEGMTGPEIAQRTGLTEGSVRVNLHRGIALLREKLGVKES
jgi:RNA polymerase sigma-70 factor (ECF subfamily)